MNGRAGDHEEKRGRAGDHEEKRGRAGEKRGRTWEKQGRPQEEKTKRKCTRYVSEVYDMPSETEAKIRAIPIQFGYGLLSEIVFYRSYSRLKPDGGREDWHDVTCRCINGSLTILKSHLARNHLPWEKEEWDK